MLDVIKNPDLLIKYDKDKEQLKYEKEILEVISINHKYIKYIHPAILLKNHEVIFKEFGNSIKYLDYLPLGIINRYQDELFEFSKKNPKVFKHINYDTQNKYINDVLIYIKENPINYDYLDKKIKKNNKELFNYVFNKLYRIKDIDIVDIYYDISINNSNLLHIISDVLLDKELLIILGNSIDRIIRTNKLYKQLERIYSNKKKYIIFKYLLSLYKDKDYIENYFDKIEKLINKEYYLFSDDNDILKLDYDLLTLLSKEELERIDIKRLYYLLNTDFIHINKIDDFYELDNIRTNKLDNYPLDSLIDYKRVLCEYKYCMSYEQVLDIVDNYSYNLNSLLSKYKKFKYKVDEIEEYEALLTLKEMVTIVKLNKKRSLEEYLRDTLLTYKESRSLDIYIYLEDILNEVNNKELVKNINKKTVYSKEEKVLYEDLVSKNKQQREYINKEVIIRTIDTHSDINILIKELDNDDYIYINNDYLKVNSDSNYIRLLEVSKDQIRVNNNNYIVNDIDAKRSILCIDKVNIRAIKYAIDNNLIIDILNTKELTMINNKRIDSLINKILHYINPDYQYVIDYYKSITPINSIPILVNLYNNMYLTNSKNYPKNRLTNMLNNILDEVDKIDNIIIIKQTLNMLYDVLMNENIVSFDRRVVLRNIDKLYKKYSLYKKDANTYQDYYLMLETNLNTDKKYNVNQLEYVDVKNKINLDKVRKYIRIIKNESIYQDIPTVIRHGVLASILTKQVYPSIINIAMVSVMFYQLGNIPTVDRTGDYSASIFRNIFKDKMTKEDINLVCAAIDYQDSKEDINKIKNKYKIKDIDKLEELIYIVKDVFLLDNYKSKKEFHNKQILKLIKVNNVIKDNFLEYEIDKYIEKNVISRREVEELKTINTLEEIRLLCEK